MNSCLVNSISNEYYNNNNNNIIIIIGFATHSFNEHSVKIAYVLNWTILNTRNKQWQSFLYSLHSLHTITRLTSRWKKNEKIKNKKKKHTNTITKRNRSKIKTLAEKLNVFIIDSTMGMCYGVLWCTVCYVIYLFSYSVFAIHINYLA